MVLFRSCRLLDVPQVLSSTCAQLVSVNGLIQAATARLPHSSCIVHSIHIKKLALTQCIAALFILAVLVNHSARLASIVLCLLCICRFVKNQLVVEITSSAKLAHLFGWIMRRHSLIAYSLYTAGKAGYYDEHSGLSTCHLSPVSLTVFNCKQRELMQPC